MPNSWLRAMYTAKRRHLFLSFFSPSTSLITNNYKGKIFADAQVPNSHYNGGNSSYLSRGSLSSNWLAGKSEPRIKNCSGLEKSAHNYLRCQCTRSASYSSVAGPDSLSTEELASASSESEYESEEVEETISNDEKTSRSIPKTVDFTQIDKELLPSVLIVGRPNVGKSALFNRLIGRREALVYNTPADHVTRDIREAVAKLGNLRFKVLDSAGLEAAATSGSILGRTADMTANVLSKSQFAMFLFSARDGLQPMDFQVGKWLRRHAPGIKIFLVMNKSEALDETDGTLAAASGEAYDLGFGDPIAISAETGLGMSDLYNALRPTLENYMLEVLDATLINNISESDESKSALQLALVGRPNVGKSTLLNTLLQENRVLVGPEAGLTRDSIRAQFQYDDRTIYMVDTAGWLERTRDKGPSSLSIMQTKKNLQRAHVIALVLDGEEVASTRRSLKHAEIVIARQAVEEGRGLVVVVNKIDLLKRNKNSMLYEKVTKAVPEEIKKLIPQVTGIPVVFVSALEGEGRIAVMNKVIETYEKWCLRLPTAKLNKWLQKVMSRHSWKDLASQPKIKYFTQVKARPPTFVAFVKGKVELPETDVRFLIRSLKEDFDLGGIPVRILQRPISRKAAEGNVSSSFNKKVPSTKVVPKATSDKRTTVT